MKRQILEKKKYSIHNLVKLINERNKQKGINGEDVKCIMKKELGNGMPNEGNFNMDNHTSVLRRREKEKESGKEMGKEMGKEIGKGIKGERTNSESKESVVKCRTLYNNVMDDDNSRCRNDKPKGTNQSKDMLSEKETTVGIDTMDDADITEEISENFDEYSQKENKKEDVQEIKLFMIDYNECQNNKCSCKKLYRFKKIKKVQVNKKFKGIVLTPYGDKYFSLYDKQIIENFGLSVIDCSWKSVDLLKKIKFTNQRKLPYTIAVNSINYGKPYKLSCLESLAFCLYVCNYNKQCRDILSIYKWSIYFTTVNKDFLDKYKLCYTHNDIINAENELIQDSLNEKEERKKIDHYKIIYEDNYM
ncbi:ribosome biogenesis protein TSR3, putative [Plasmodium malariae]|uniref:18S rRNA aminocarboxypropyltransferase n=1 Tax=Plasmodium malariae TaxID=5858 RepID=A0A1C3L2T2_PLAMA|nr:ribosome biogenesis protein TSR3, putative [Plasmodium malariae]